MIRWTKRLVSNYNSIQLAGPPVSRCSKPHFRLRVFIEGERATANWGLIKN